jgi:hypothetical protein
MACVKCSKCKKSSLNTHSYGDLEEQNYLTCKFCKHENDEFYFNRAASLMKKIDVFLEQNKLKFEKSENTDKLVELALELINQSKSFFNPNENIQCIKLFELLAEFFVKTENYTEAIKILSNHQLEYYK